MRVKEEEALVHRIFTLRVLEETNFKPIMPRLRPDLGQEGDKVMRLHFLHSSENSMGGLVHDFKVHAVSV